MKKVMQRVLAASVISLIAAGSAQAAIGPFVGSGPGSTIVTQPTPNSVRLVYDNNGFGPDTFTLTGTATSTGSTKFSYDSAGFYSFFRVRASANAFSNGVTTNLYSFGPQNCCTPPSGGFRYLGFVTLQLVAGQTYGFSVTGSNFDIARKIQGELNVSAVPEPASWALMIVGFGLVGAVARTRPRALAS